MSTTTLLSIEQFFNLPELDAGKRELIEGELIELPPAKALHTFIAGRISDALKDYLRSQGQPRERVCTEPGFEIATRRRSWLQPDVALLHPGQTVNNAGYLEGAPLIAIEVISPMNTARDIDPKRLIYLAHGSAEVWIVYPETRTVTAERAHEGVRHESAIVSALLPGFCLDFDELFQTP